MFETDFSRCFGGIARLYSEQALQILNKTHICVVGLGGVGSWVVEALARTGVGAMTLIDLDNVAQSNINRQQPAVLSQLGMPKVDAMAKRVRDINPACRLSLVEDFVTEENIPVIFSQPFDMVVDAIDQVRVKAAMADFFITNKQPFIVSGGAGGRTDPTKIQVAPISQVTHDSLLANMRYTLRKRYHYRDKAQYLDKITCVFSPQQVVKPVAAQCETPLSGLSCAGYGASMMVTASFGMVCAAKAVDMLLCNK